MNALAIGSQVMYRAPYMPRKMKGTVVGFESLFDLRIQPVRQGRVFRPQQVTLDVRNICTLEEHRYVKPAPPRQGRLLAAEFVNERGVVGAARLGIAESEVLSHPAVLLLACQRVRALAGRNFIRGTFSVHNGALSHDDADGADLCSAFTLAMLGSLRRQTANAAEELLDEFRSFLSGGVAFCRVVSTMLRDGKTAALRFLNARKDYWRDIEVYDTVAEADFENGMAAISWQIATGGGTC